MKGIFIIPLFLCLLVITPVVANQIPEIATQDVTIEFQITEEWQTPYSEGFKALNKEQFLVWLREYDETDKNDYSFPDYVCYDFSNDLRDNFYNDYGFYGVYKTWHRIPSGDAHAMNAVLIGDNPYLIGNWLIVEPQLDYYQKHGDALFDWQYPIKISFYYPLSGRKYAFICMYLCSRDSEPLFFIRPIDIDTWIERHKHSTFNDWVYDKFVDVLRSEGEDIYISDTGQ